MRKLVAVLLDSTPTMRRVLVPRWMALPYFIAGLVMLTGSAVLTIGTLVFGRPHPVLYPVVLVVATLFSVAGVTLAGLGVWIHADGILVVNLLWVRRLRWEEIDQFTLGEPIFGFALAHLRRHHDSVTLMAIRSDPSWTALRRGAEQAIDRLNQELQLARHEPPTP